MSRSDPSTSVQMYRGEQKQQMNLHLLNRGHMNVALEPEPETVNFSPLTFRVSAKKWIDTQRSVIQQVERSSNSYQGPV